MASLTPPNFTAANFARAGKDPKDDTVSASTQAELPELTDADVVRLAQQGDALAFERLYRRHSRKVYTLCLRMVGDRTDAEDLTQEVFLQLFRKIHQFRGESAFSTWLHRMSVNIVLMRFRKKNLVEQSLETVTNHEDGSSSASQEFGAPDLRLSGAVDRITLETAINELPPGYKAMFILHDVQGYNHDEIAGIFGCTAGNSKSQVHKARTRLRELLQRGVGAGGLRLPKSHPRSASMDRMKYVFDFVNA
jgi:RNA polymerase sigma-70 factor (ECF subfamily)